MKKRLMALMLVICMTLSLVSGPVRAAGEITPATWTKSSLGYFQASGNSVSLRAKFNTGEDRSQTVNGALVPVVNPSTVMQLVSNRSDGDVFTLALFDSLESTRTGNPRSVRVPGTGAAVDVADLFNDDWYSGESGFCNPDGTSLTEGKLYYLTVGNVTYETLTGETVGSPSAPSQALMVVPVVYTSARPGEQVVSLQLAGPGGAVSADQETIHPLSRVRIDGMTEGDTYYLSLRNINQYGYTEGGELAYSSTDKNGISRLMFYDAELEPGRTYRLQGYKSSSPGRMYTKDVVFSDQAPDPGCPTTLTVTQGSGKDFHLTWDKPAGMAEGLEEYWQHRASIFLPGIEYGLGNEMVEGDVTEIEMSMPWTWQYDEDYHGPVFFCVSTFIESDCMSNLWARYDIPAVGEDATAPVISGQGVGMIDGLEGGHFDGATTFTATAQDETELRAGAFLWRRQGETNWSFCGDVRWEGEGSGIHGDGQHPLLRLYAGAGGDVSGQVPGGGPGGELCGERAPERGLRASHGSGGVDGAGGGERRHSHLGPGAGSTALCGLYQAGK